MGLLDDAIRDHLELKRRRGADPAEVERAEKEALGPVRRQPEGSDDLDFADEPVAAADPRDAGSDDLFYDDDELAYDDLGRQAGSSDPGPAPPAQELEPPRPVEELDPPRPASSSGRRDRLDAPDPGVDTKPHEAVRPDPREPAAPSSEPRGGEEGGDYDAEPRASAGDEREDVLEETPEFLQDTPEHDRLWFEQRPPRDFNFDG